VKAIVLRIDSPGGTYPAADAMADGVARARANGKPVIVSMGDVAASGGYLAAVRADVIVAEPATITGSIGVFALMPRADQTLAKLGVHPGGVGTTWLLNADDPRLPLDPRRAEVVQKIVDHTYLDFTTKVAAARKTSVDKIDAVAQGRVWTGAQAKDRGLVDDFGGLDKAIEVAKELAKIPKDKGVERVILPYPQTFLQQLLSGANDSSNTKVEQQRAIAAALPEDAKRALRYMALMDQMRNGEVMLLMPFDIRIR